MTAEKTVKIKSRRRRMTAPEVLRMQRLCRECLLAGFLQENLQPGALIDGERNLSLRYGIPISVIRTTLAELKNDGVILCVPRSGMRLAAIPELPKTLAGTRFAMVGYMDEEHSEAKFTRPAVICDGLERLLNQQGATLHFYNTCGNDDFGLIADGIREWKADGIVYIKSAAGLLERELPPLLDLGIPVVAIESHTTRCHTVAFDNEQIGQKQAEYLLDLGHREVCVLGLSEQKWSDIRVASIQREFTRRGIKAPDIYRLRADADEIDPLVAVPLRKYSACIAVNDTTAALLADAAFKAKIRIPEELSIIGADDSPGRRHYNLTTIQLSPRELGLAAFTILKEAFLDSAGTRAQAPQHVRLKCPLIVRKTTRIYQ